MTATTLECTCLLCGRQSNPQRTLIAIRAKRAPSCEVCGGRVLLSPRLLTQSGGATDPTIPARIATRAYRVVGRGL